MSSSARPPNTVPSSDGERDDMATLAKGGRTNTIGFFIRLLGGLPFLFIGYRFYGVEDMGRFAVAFVVIEIFALFCALGEKRGLALRLTDNGDVSGVKPANIVFDGMLAAFCISALIAVMLATFPAIMFPNGMNGSLDIWMVATIPAFALTEILLAAQAYKYDIATTVRARALVEPWARSLAVLAFFYIPGMRESGLALAFIFATYAGLATAAFSFFRTYGLPENWRPRPREMLRMVSRAFPLAGADVIERSTRLIDVFLLGQFTSGTAVGIYFFAKEVASLPQKLKQSFEPILSPVITKNLKIGNMDAIAKQVRQVGFWIIALQVGIALTLAIPGEAVMGLGGPAIVGGTGALVLLLAAEAIASMAVVAESVLVYIAKKRNLLISAGIITLQAALTVGFIMVADNLGLDEGFKAAGAALALFVALGTSSLVKALLLKSLLKAPISNWRWALVYAAAPAVVVGFLFTEFTPEWVEIVLGGPMILAVYLAVIWKRGFTDEDKMLFAKKEAPAQPDSAPEQSK